MATWLFSLLLSLLTVLYYYSRSLISSDTVTLLLTRLASLYSPFVTTITTFYYLSGRTQDRLKPAQSNAYRVAYRLALSVSVVWNFLIFTVIFVVPWFVSGGMEESLEISNQFSAVLSTLAGVALGYFFAKDIPDQNSQKQ